MKTGTRKRYRVVSGSDYRGSPWETGFAVLGEKARQQITRLKRQIVRYEIAIGSLIKWSAPLTDTHDPSSKPVIPKRERETPLREHNGSAEEIGNPFWEKGGSFKKNGEPKWECKRPLRNTPEPFRENKRGIFEADPFTETVRPFRRERQPVLGELKRKISTHFGRTTNHWRRKGAHLRVTYANISRRLNSRKNFTNGYTPILEVVYGSEPAMIIVRPKPSEIGVKCAIGKVVNFVLDDEIISLSRLFLW